MKLNNYQKDFVRRQYFETDASVRKTQGVFFKKYNEHLLPAAITQIWRCSGFLLNPHREHKNGISKDFFVEIYEKYRGNFKMIKKE